MQERQTTTDSPRVLLDREVSLWSKRGYRVASRSTSAAQLAKRTESLLLPLIAVWLVVCVIAWKVLVMVGYPDVAAVFLVGLIFIAAFHATRGEHLVYLTVAPDGDITQD